MKAEHIYLIALVAVIAVLGYVTYLYLNLSGKYQILSTLYLSAIGSRPKPGIGAVSINLTRVYLTYSGYALVFTIYNPTNETQYLYGLDVGNLPFVNTGVYIGNVAIPPNTAYQLPIFIYFNSTLLSANVFYFNHVTGGSETMTYTMIGPVAYAPSTIIGSMVSVSYSAPNGSLVNRYFYITLNNSKFLNSTIFASAMFSDQWPTYILLTFISQAPFQITGYSLIAPNGTVVLSCSSTSGVTYPNGTYLNLLPPIVGQVYLPLTSANSQTHVRYWIGSGLTLTSGWSTINYTISASCRGPYIMAATPRVGYALELNYQLSNGASGTLTIPVTYYTDSLVLWG